MVFLNVTMKRAKNSATPTLIARATQQSHQSAMLFKLVVCCLVGGSAYAFMTHRLGAVKSSRLSMEMQHGGLKIDMTGKKVFIGGVADSTGYGWAIAKACAEAGAEIILGTWPPVLPMFQMGIDRGQFEADSVLTDGSKMKVAKVSDDRCFELFT
jgi:hypothetical protein